MCFETEELDGSGWVSVGASPSPSLSPPQFDELLYRKSEENIACENVLSEAA